MPGRPRVTDLNCKFCDRQFTKSEHLKRHQRHHTGEKPFRCSVCGRAYARSDVLARHLRTRHAENEGLSTLAVAAESATLATTSPNAFENQQDVDFNPEMGVNLSPLEDLPLSMTTSGGDANNDATQLQLHNNQIVTAGQVEDFQYPAFEFPTEYDFNFPSIYEALNVWLTPTAAAEHSMLPFPASPGGAFSSSFSPTSLELSHRVQQAWPRRRACAVVLAIRNMWRVAAQRTADNLFSNSSITSGTKISSRWNMDDECRARLISECDNILLPAERYSGRVTAPGSPRISVPMEHDVEVQGLSPGAPALTFPSTETLDMSISLYFRRFHPVLPFVHQATFDAKSTPSSLLLPMCLIGLSILNPGGADELIRLYLGKLLRFCRLDLTYKGLGKGGAQQLVTSLASSLLVLYLALSCERLVDVHQAHMLAIQTLFIADRHGMFSAHVGETITQTMLHDVDQERAWKAWARVESLKRLVVCLISIDSAYTRMLDLAANIAVDRIEVILPCDSALFEAPTAASFWRRVEFGTSMIASQVDMSTLPHDSISELDLSGVKLLLDVLALREAAARHRLLFGGSASFRLMSFVPALAYAAIDKASSIAPSLVSVATTRAMLLQQDAPTALAWHHLCLMLTADLDRIQTACGRTGLEASARAMTDLKAWAQTTRARRAVLHAAQIFTLLSGHRVLDHKTLLYEPLLSNAALVTAMYVALCPQSPDSLYGGEPVDLLQTVDWAVMGNRGFSPSPNSDVSSFVPDQTAACKFVTNGGPFMFGGEVYTFGTRSARRVVLNYAQLMDEIATRTGSEHSQLLRTVGDFLGGVEEVLPDLDAGNG
ncbi:hypothetical protein LTR92_001833 [Exophiala xenobiotica]|nr:hypothetical protein LTR92_001833 [Exophiala xenobiotica]